jgi:hypothetical protein
MRKEYDEIVRNVCKLTNWKLAPTPEKEGAIGVAIVLAFRRGVAANESDLARDIGVPIEEVVTPFKRLLVNSIFSTKFDVRNDPVYSGECGDADVNLGHEMVVKASERTRNAWANVAGLAGGLTGLRDYNEVAEAA